MLDPKKQAELEQAASLLIEFYPPVWRQMYDCLIREGFSESESFRLVQTYILSQCPHGIRGAE